MDKIPELTDGQIWDFKKGQAAYEEWVDKKPEKQKASDPLPDWFDLKKYEPTTDFTLSDWIRALAIRSILLPIVYDGPQLPPDYPFNQFIKALREQPLKPNFDLCPAAKTELEDLYSECKPGGRRRNFCPDKLLFPINPDLDDHLIIDCLKKTLALTRSEEAIEPMRHRRVDYSRWGKLNILGIIDLQLWGISEQKDLSWDLKLAIGELAKDESTVRKQIADIIDNIFYHRSGLELLMAQEYLEK